MIRISSVTIGTLALFGAGVSYVFDIDPGVPRDMEQYYEPGLLGLGVLCYLIALATMQFRLGGGGPKQKAEKEEPLISFQDGSSGVNDEVKFGSVTPAPARGRSNRPASPRAHEPNDDYVSFDD